MKKRKTLLTLAVTALILALVFSGCGAQKSEESPKESSQSAYNNEGYRYDSADYEGTDNTADTGNAGSGVYTADPALKIIYTANLSLESKEFDRSYKDLEALVEKYGGYISDVSSSGGYTYSDGSTSPKRAAMTVRVPVENFRAFISATGDVATVTSQDSYTQDVTSSYVDTAARIEALEAQREQLMSYLKNAKNVTEMLEVQDRLYDVIYELESYQSQLNSYDDRINYSTVYIDIVDVSNTTIISRTFGQDFAQAVQNSWRSVVNFLQKLVIAIVWVIPYALVFGIIYFVVSRVYRAIRKKFPPSEERLAAREAKRAEREAKKAARRRN